MTNDEIKIFAKEYFRLDAVISVSVVKISESIEINDSGQLSFIEGVWSSQRSCPLLLRSPELAWNNYHIADIIPFRNIDNVPAGRWLRLLCNAVL